MSTLVKTEAVVLRSMKYRETSKIVTFYTRAFGKIKAIAKGARQQDTKFGSSLEPMSYVMLVFYKKDQRDLHLVSQCDLLHPFHRLSDDLGKLAVGLSVVELMDKVSHDEESNEKLFRLLMNSLLAIHGATKNLKNVLYAFEANLAAVLGFQPTLSRCVVCGRPFEGSNRNVKLFHVGKGGPLCSLHTDSEGLKVRISPESLRAFSNLMAEDSFSKLEMVDIPQAQRDEMEGILLGYLRYHIDGLHNLKAMKMLSQIPL